MIESLAVDMHAEHVLQLLQRNDEKDWPGWLAWIERAPVYMTDQGPVSLGANRETWGIDLDEFDEPEPAALLDDASLPDTPGAPA